ncbi:ATP-binding cassette, subfamily B, MsbA [Allopseudospirillum japonicum]|uniref:ATP-binding cassette, subfamily B, MsbA n=1 Tax=Allopseudospirillum japonicum TaxID=64971 RepID=A0A1H6T9B2_9GAMM|nr:lipid A export permease/ATP-binding protein MsbA [Allopseudospirillum japonicum]SEI76693.1 ATP-binding cassette, subfamily B, MsbA [Allopseudospirillum japonicum]
MNKTEESVSAWQDYRRLLTYVRPYWMAFAVSVFGYALYAGASTGLAELMKYLIDSIQNAQVSQERWLFPSLMVAVFAVRGLGTFLGTYYMEYVGRHLVHALRCDLFNRLLILPSAFFDQESSGHLISKVTFNVEQVTEAATKAVTILVREGLFVIGLLIYLFYNNWQLSLVFLAITPLIGLVVSYASRRFRRISRRIQNSMGDVTHVASEAISGYRVVRTFGGEAYERERFLHASLYNRQQSMKMALTKAISTPVIQLIIALAMGFLVWLALSPELLQSMTPGEFIAFITAAALLAKPMRQLTEINSIIQRGLAAAQDVFQQLDTAPEQDTGTLVLTEKAQGHLHIRDLSFRYPGAEKEALQDINLAIPAGQMLALVGRSGSGKSTLASLIPRLYHADQGSIALDGRAIQDFTLASLRAQVALVTQQVTLFNDTVANNIAYGQADATEEQIYAAAKAAYALDFIEALPQGFDTFIGDNGVTLSGGQRQRLAIARALLKDAPILILDEATSALDNESERYIQQALDQLMQGRTTLVIAHRLSTIEKADQIVVMENGRIVEQGTHTDLLAAQGAYAHLHQMQFSAESVHDQ